MSEVFRCDDKETLVAYLYGEVDANVCREVERHLRTCAACARETEGLQAVRDDLQTWRAPEPALDFAIVRRTADPAQTATVLRPSRWAVLREVPRWAQVAAAALLVGIGLGLANVQVRSSSDGVVVTTGWSRPAPAVVAPVAVAPAAVRERTSESEWRRELAALEQTLRSEIAAQRAAVRVAVSASRHDTNVDAAAVMRRVEAMIEASENRQRQELATKLVQANTMWTVQRQTDLANFQRSFSGLQNRTLAVQANQQEITNQVKHLRANFVQPNQ